MGEEGEWMGEEAGLLSRRPPEKLHLNQCRVGISTSVNSTITPPQSSTSTVLISQLRLLIFAVIRSTVWIGVWVWIGDAAAGVGPSYGPGGWPPVQVENLEESF